MTTLQPLPKNLTFDLSAHKATAEVRNQIRADIEAGTYRSGDDYDTGGYTIVIDSTPLVADQQ